MAGGTQPLSHLITDAQQVLAHLERVAALAYLFVPAFDEASWNAALSEFTNHCRKEAARQLAEAEALKADPEVPF